MARPDEEQGKGLNSNYSYKEQEIYLLLQLSALKNKIPNKVYIAPPLDNSHDKQLAKYLRRFITTKPELSAQGTLLIPYLINLDRWVGLVITWDRELKHSQFKDIHCLLPFDKPKIYKPVLKELAKELQEENFSNNQGKAISISPHKAAWSKEWYSSGPLTVENLIAYAMPEPASADTEGKGKEKAKDTHVISKQIREIDEERYRQEHADLLKIYYPVFYHGFIKRQQTETSAAAKASQTDKQPKLDDVKFTRREQQRILSIVELLQRLNEDNLTNVILEKKQTKGKDKKIIEEDTSSQSDDETEEDEDIRSGYLEEIRDAIVEMMNAFKSKRNKGKEDVADKADLQTLKELLCHSFASTKVKKRTRSKTVTRLKNLDSLKQELKSEHITLKVNYYELKKIAQLINNNEALVKLTVTCTKETSDYVLFLERNQLRFLARTRQEGLPEPKNAIIWHKILCSIIYDADCEEEVTAQVNRPYAFMQALNDPELKKYIRQQDMLVRAAIDMFERFKSDVGTGTIKNDLKVILPFARCRNIESQDYNILKPLMYTLVHKLESAQEYRTEPRLYSALTQIIIQKYYHQKADIIEDDLIGMLDTIIDKVILTAEGEVSYIAGMTLIYPRLNLLIALLGCLHIAGVNIYSETRHEKLIKIFNALQNNATSIVLGHLVSYARKTFLTVKKEKESTTYEKISEAIKIAIPVLTGAVGLASAIVSAVTTFGISTAFAIPGAVSSSIEAITPLLDYLRQIDSQEPLAWCARLAVIEGTIIKLQRQGKNNHTSWQALIKALTEPENVIYKYSSPDCVKVLTDLMTRQFLMTNNKTVQLEILKFFDRYFRKIILDPRKFMYAHIKFLNDIVNPPKPDSHDRRFDTDVCAEIKRLEAHMGKEKHLIRPPTNENIIDEFSHGTSRRAKKVGRLIKVTFKSGVAPRIIKKEIKKKEVKPMEAAMQEVKLIITELKKRNRWLESWQPVSQTEGESKGKGKNEGEFKAENFTPPIMKEALRKALEQDQPLPGRTPPKATIMRLPLYKLLSKFKFTFKHKRVGGKMPKSMFTKGFDWDPEFKGDTRSLLKKPPKITFDSTNLPSVNDIFGNADVTFTQETLYSVKTVTYGIEVYNDDSPTKNNSSSPQTPPTGVFAESTLKDIIQSYSKHENIFSYTKSSELAIKLSLSKAPEGSDQNAIFVNILNFLNWKINNKRCIDIVKDEKDPLSVSLEVKNKQDITTLTAACRILESLGIKNNANELQSDPLSESQASTSSATTPSPSGFQPST